MNSPVNKTVEAEFIWLPTNDNLCQVQCQGHRFWVKDVTVIDSHTIVGIVDSHVTGTTFSLGEKIMFTCDQSLSDTGLSTENPKSSF